MAVFAFEAIDQAGRRVRKEIDASDKNDAIQKIRTMGLRPNKIQEKKGIALDEQGPLMFAGQQLDDNARVSDYTRRVTFMTAAAAEAA